MLIPTGIATLYESILADVASSEIETENDNWVCVKMDRDLFDLVKKITARVASAATTERKPE